MISSHPQHMFQGDDGIIAEHPGSSVAHDSPDPLAFLGDVAVDDAPGAEVLSLLEGTAVQPLVAVMEKVSAILA